MRYATVFVECEKGDHRGLRISLAVGVTDRRGKHKSNDCGSVRECSLMSGQVN